MNLILLLLAFGILILGRSHEKALREHKRRKYKEVGEYLFREKL